MIMTNITTKFKKKEKYSKNSKKNKKNQNIFPKLKRSMKREQENNLLFLKNLQKRN